MQFEFKYVFRYIQVCCRSLRPPRSRKENMQGKFTANTTKEYTSMTRVISEEREKKEYLFVSDPSMHHFYTGLHYLMEITLEPDFILL